MIMIAMDQPETIYLRRRAPDQPVWRWIACTDYPVPMPLRFLVTQERVHVGRESAQSVLDWLHGERFHEDGALPVEVVDRDGRPVALAAA